jgi:hypothetical protein
VYGLEAELRRQPLCVWLHGSDRIDVKQMVPLAAVTGALDGRSVRNISAATLHHVRRQSTLRG